MELDEEIGKVLSGLVRELERFTPKAARPALVRSYADEIARDPGGTLGTAPAGGPSLARHVQLDAETDADDDRAEAAQLTMPICRL
jgi:hypothetical protein